MKVVSDHGLTVPLLCCDVCGVWIDDAASGVAVFAVDRSGAAQAVALTHAGACRLKAEAGIRGRGLDADWRGLKRYFADMLHNSGLSLADLLRQEATPD